MKPLDNGLPLVVRVFVRGEAYTEFLSFDRTFHIAQLFLSRRVADNTWDEVNYALGNPSDLLVGVWQASEQFAPGGYEVEDPRVETAIYVRGEVHPAQT